MEVEPEEEVQEEIQEEPEKEPEEEPQEAEVQEESEGEPEEESQEELEEEPEEEEPQEEFEEEPEEKEPKEEIQEEPEEEEPEEEVQEESEEEPEEEIQEEPEEKPEQESAESRQVEMTANGGLPIVNPEDMSRVWHFAIQAMPDEDDIELALEYLEELAERSSRAVPRSVVKITGQKLNQKGLVKSIDKLLGKTILIEDAADMNERVINEFCKIIDPTDRSLLVVFIDTPASIRHLLIDYPQLAQVVTAQFVRETYSVTELLEYARGYADREDSVFDKSGELALMERLKVIAGNQERNKKRIVETHSPITVTLPPMPRVPATAKRGIPTDPRSESPRFSPQRPSIGKARDLTLSAVLPPPRECPPHPPSPRPPAPRQKSARFPRYPPNLPETPPSPPPMRRPKRRSVKVTPA